VPTGVTSPGNVNTFNTTRAGTYSLTITNSNNCISEVGTGVVTVNALPATPTITSPAVCVGEEATLLATVTPTGTYTYTWQVPTGVTSPGNVNTFNTTRAGAYSLTITNSNNCISEVGTGVVTVNALPATPTITSPAVCVGEEATLLATVTPTGTYTYTWQVPTGVTSPGNVNTFNTTRAGAYSLTITNSNNCISEVGTGVVTVNALPATPTITSPAVCVGEEATLLATVTPTGTYTYTWQVPTGVTSPGNVNTFNTTRAGTYSLTITNSNNCISEIGTGVVTVNALPTVTITNPAAVCAPGTVDLTATSVTTGSTLSTTFTYFTNAAATTALTTPSAVAVSGTYYIKGTSAESCVKVSPVVVAINPIPAFSLISNAVCVGSPASITVTPSVGGVADYTYSWTVPSGVAAPGSVASLSTNTPGNYAVKILNKNTLCESLSSNKSISFYPLPVAAPIVANGNKVIVNKSLNLTASATSGTSPYSYTWQPTATLNYRIIGQDNAVFEALKEGKVNIKYEVKDANNCVDNSADYEINIESEDIVLVLPNAFTPNGDGNNDVFKIASSNLLGKAAFRSFDIYNRNGKLMFSTTNLTAGWDGRYKEVMQDMGVYFVKLVKLNKDGQQVVETTPIYLLK
jgi:gliding motility-associated-like protein